MQKYDDIFKKLAKSAFRSSFKLKENDKLYIKEKGLDKIREHTKEFIQKRIAPKYIKNDGKQTPTKGHPAFIAQHATGSCCRKCIEKWHKFKSGVELTQKEQEYLANLIMRWIELKIKEN